MDKLDIINGGDAGLSLTHLSSQPIGVFDSGLGGLSIVRALLSELPNESFIYVADTAHVPYGGKPSDEIYERMRVITSFLLSKGCKAIVVACNTATAAGIERLRAEFHCVPFIAIEPAIKPAVEASLTKHIAVFATYHTIHSARTQSLVTRFGGDCQIELIACPGLADAIEDFLSGLTRAEQLIDLFCQPLTSSDIDQIVLGCTHYPLVLNKFMDVLGSDRTYVEPGIAVAKQVLKQLALRNINAVDDDTSVSLPVQAYATAQTLRLKGAIHQWLGREIIVNLLYI